MASKRRLGRPTDQRMLMLRNLVTSLLDKGRIVTTVTRAKEARSLAEEMITLAKKGRQVFRLTCDLVIQRFQLLD